MNSAARFALIIAVVIISSADSRAGFILSVGSNITLLPDTQNQAVEVFLTSNDVADPDLTGMDVRAYLGNSYNGVLDGQEGKFQQGNAVVLTGTDYFWGASAISGFPGVTDVAIREANVRLPDGTQRSVLNGAQGPVTVKVATLYIDTTQLFSGTYAISLNDPYTISASGTLTSTLTDLTGARLTPGFQNGSFTITAVPEPGSLLLTAGIALAGAALRFRKRSISSSKVRNAI